MSTVHVGDRVRIAGRHVDDAARTGRVIEIRGQDGAAPYLVRFEDGHEALVFPGPDCLITSS